MRRSKHLDRGGGGGTELFICFTSRPSAASAASAAAAAPATLRPSSSSKLLSPGRAAAGAAEAPQPPLPPSLSRRLRSSGSLKGGQSPMFPSGSSSSGGRRGRGGFEPAEPSSPKVTCIGQVRVKGGKRKPKHAAAASLRSRSRRGGNAEASFRRGGEADCPPCKNQGWVYQIPVNICEALKTFGSCGGRSLCSPSRGNEKGVAVGGGGAVGGGHKRRRRAAGGNWLCGAALARWLMAIQEEEEEERGKASGAVAAEEVKGAELGLVMEGWEVEDREEVVVGEVEVEKKDEILVVGKEDEGRVSVCIPPRNALLLMRCRSDPVRMAALATRFWGSPAAATVGQVDDEEEDEEEEEEEEDGEVEKECEEKVGDVTSSVKVVECGELCGAEEVEDKAVEVDHAEVVAEEISKCGDLGQEGKDGGGVEGEKDEIEEAQIIRKDAGLEVALGEATGEETQVRETVEEVMEAKEEEDNAPRMGKEEEEAKGRRSSSCCSPSTALKEDRKLRRLGSRRRVGSSGRVSLGCDRAGRRHSFSADTDARRSSFSSLKDSRRASFSIDRDGRRWSFSIEQEHLVAGPKVLMSSRKGKKVSPEPEIDKDCAVLGAPNSVEEAQEIQDDEKEEATKDVEEEGDTRDAETNEKVEKVEPREEEEEEEEEQRKKQKSGELPDCLLLMMYEPKLSMEVSKETWVCSTDFVHWKSYQGQNRRNRRQPKAAAGDEKPKDKDNVESTMIAMVAEESKMPTSINLMSKPPAGMQQPPSKGGMEQKLKLELPLVTSAGAYAPFVLKRCKSEPMRSSARLAPDACFWKDRHRPLDATGIGF